MGGTGVGAGGEIERERERMPKMEAHLVMFLCPEVGSEVFSLLLDSPH